MSLRDVKVGDVVVIHEWRSMPGSRYPVTTVGRRYITAGHEQFSIETGQKKGPVYGATVYAYTEAQWARKEAETALRAVWNRCGRLNAKNLTDDEVRDLTATLQAAAEKMEKKS